MGATERELRIVHGSHLRSCRRVGRTRIGGRPAHRSVAARDDRLVARARLLPVVVPRRHAAPQACAASGFAALARCVRGRQRTHRRVQHLHGAQPGGAVRVDGRARRSRRRRTRRPAARGGTGPDASGDGSGQAVRPDEGLGRSLRRGATSSHRLRRGPDRGAGRGQSAVRVPRLVPPGRGLLRCSHARPVRPIRRQRHGAAATLRRLLARQNRRRRSTTCWSDGPGASVAVGRTTTPGPGIRGQAPRGPSGGRLHVGARRPVRHPHHGRPRRRHPEVPDRRAGHAGRTHRTSRSSTSGTGRSGSCRST